MFVAEQAGLGYDFQTSAKNADPERRQWTTPRVEGKTAREALESILWPVGLTYRVEGGKVVLERK